MLTCEDAAAEGGPDVGQSWLSTSISTAISALCGREAVGTVGRPSRSAPAISSAARCTPPCRPTRTGVGHERRCRPTRTCDKPGSNHLWRRMQQERGPELAGVHVVPSARPSLKVPGGSGKTNSATACGVHLLEGVERLLCRHVAVGHDARHDVDGSRVVMPWRRANSSASRSSRTHQPPAHCGSSGTGSRSSLRRDVSAAVPGFLRTRPGAAVRPADR